MTFLAEAWASIRDFFEIGGPVLYGILAVTTLMWALILERLWYFYRVLPGEIRSVQLEWQAGLRRYAAPNAATTEESDRPGGQFRSWLAMSVRRSILSQVDQGARHNLLLIQTLMQVLPLLGLLGTVWGMVSVFDIMTVFGTGNARLMASGISKATIPTMSGLVAALSGLYLAYWLRQRARLVVLQLEDGLKMELGPQNGGARAP